MAEIETKESEIGKVDFQWTFPEHEKHQRDRKWYVWFAIFFVGLLVFALITVNFFFAVIIILFSIIMFFREIREPENVVFMIGQTGISLGSKVFGYKDIKCFWLIYEPAKNVKNLYFETKSVFNPRLSIPLFDQNPLKIRDFLIERLEEDLEQENEPISEQLGRHFKI